MGIPHTLWAGSLEALGTLGAGFSELGGGRREGAGDRM